MSNWDSSDLGGDDPHELEREYDWSREESARAGDPGDAQLHEDAYRRAYHPGTEENQAIRAGREHLGVSGGDASLVVTRMNVWQQKQDRSRRAGMNPPDDWARIMRPGREVPPTASEIPGVAGEVDPRAGSLRRGISKLAGGPPPLPARPDNWSYYRTLQERFLPRRRGR